MIHRLLAIGGLLFLSAAVPLSAQTMSMPGMPDVKGHGAFNDYGKTNNFNMGQLTEDVYTHAWYCDVTVTAKSTSGCEVGAAFKMPPAMQYDPLYITVPLGFTEPPMMMQCPDGLTCVDHPVTLDLSAIGGPPNARTPGHDHFTTTRFGGKPEWWDVQVIGVKTEATYNDIAKHGSYQYIQKLIKAGNKDVTAPIPTNLFLYFAVSPIGS